MEEGGEHTLKHTSKHTSSSSLSASAFADDSAEGKADGEAASLAVAVTALPSERGGIVTARGTGDGLIIRLDGRVSQDALRDALTGFLESRREFLGGNEVSLEWVGAEPATDVVDQLSDLLLSKFAIQVRSSKLWEAPKSSTASLLEESAGRNDRAHDKSSKSRSISAVASSSSLKRGQAAPASANNARGFSLFDGIEAIKSKEVTSEPKAMVDPTLWDDPDARLVTATLRSGQKIETEHSLIVFGDINSGAEVIAGGDIVVLGTLRGIAHAGAYDETGGGRVIFAINLQPTQLRIGMTISRGSGSSSGGDSGSDASSNFASGAEIAVVEDGLIVVEPYKARVMASRRKFNS